MDQGRCEIACVDYIIASEEEDFKQQIENEEDVDNHIYAVALYAAYGDDAETIIKEIKQELKEK